MNKSNKDRAIVADGRVAFRSAIDAAAQTGFRSELLHRACQTGWTAYGHKWEWLDVWLLRELGLEE